LVQQLSCNHLNHLRPQNKINKKSERDSLRAPSPVV
jgi:hypothetical protein